MPLLRVFCDQAGSVLAVEHRLDETYTAENVPRDELRSATTLEVEADELAGAPVEEWQVHGGKLRRRRRSGRAAQPAPADRLAELQAMDKSKLSDAQWLRLFREYVSLGGSF